MFEVFLIVLEICHGQSQVCPFKMIIKVVDTENVLELFATDIRTQALYLSELLHKLIRVRPGPKRLIVLTGEIYNQNNVCHLWQDLNKNKQTAI